MGVGERDKNNIQWEIDIRLPETPEDRENESRFKVKAIRRFREMGEVYRTMTYV